MVRQLEAWQSQLHTQRGWAKRCLLHGCKAVLPSASPGARKLWAWYGRTLVLVLNAQKHQHSKRPPQHQGVKRRNHQSLALRVASLPANQTSWSQGVKECKIWGHGPQQCQPLKVPSVRGAHMHLQVPPHVRSAHGDRLWQQRLQKRNSVGHAHPHWALGATRRHQALLRRTATLRQRLARSERR